MQLVKNIKERLSKHLEDKQPSFLFDQVENPPSFTYELIMISMYAAEQNEEKLFEFKKQALAKGAEIAQIEHAVYRGEQLSVIDTLD